MIKLRTILLQSNIYRVTIVGVIIYALIVTLLPKYESVYKGSEEDFLCSIDNYKIEEDKVDVSAAWKLLHQILLNYFEEIAATDLYGGYLQTPWQYKTFTLSEKQIRNRVTIRDISTPKRVAFQIKVASEVAGSNAARHGEFTEADRIPKELEPIIEELQTRIGKVSSL